MYERILAAIDATPHTKAVLEQTRQLARLVGASVHVLHVQPTTTPQGPFPALRVLEGTPLAGVPAEDTAAQRMVDDAVAEFTAAGICAVGEVLEIPSMEGPEAVLERARELDVQLIVLGPRHHGWLVTLFRPSVADHLAHHSPCPILLVP